MLPSIVVLMLPPLRFILVRNPTFDTCVPLVPAGRRQAKPISDGCKGINLGYAGSMRNVLFWDLKTEKIGKCLHGIFNEAMNDLHYDEKPPNARLLDCLKTGKLNEIDIGDTPFLT